jgi:hypothetical protein
MVDPGSKRKEKTKKRLEDMLRNSTFILLFLLFAFLIVSYGPEELSLKNLTGYVSFNSGPALPSARTTDNLQCSWTYDNTINITFVWLKGGVQFSNVTGNITTVTSPQTLDSSNTTKGENWTCRVTLFNATDNITSETSIDILNTRPTVPVINYSGTPINSPYSLTEDVVYNFVINSIDVDDDTLVYGIVEDIEALAICGISDKDITCLVEHGDLLNASSDEENRVQNVTFYADDNDDEGIENKKIQFNLLSVNDAPVITLGTLVTDVTVDNVYVQDFSVSDEEENAYDLNVSVVKVEGFGDISDYIELDTSESENVYFNTTDGTAGVIDYGVYNITIYAFDSSNYSVNFSVTYELIINSTNHDPVLSAIGSQSGVQGQPFIIYLSAYDVDLNDTLNYSVVDTSFNNFTNVYNYTVNNTGYFNATLNITALTNTNIINRNFTVYVTDGASVNDYEVVNAQLNNTNDAPVIYDISVNSTNINYGSSNISNLTTYIGTNFRYVVNGSDVDSLTYEGEIVYFTMNESNGIFNLTNGGVFTFYTDDDSNICDYYINVTINDDGTSNYVSGTSLYYSKNMIVHVLNNSLPVFLSGLNNINCSEDFSCYMNITGNDTDPGDSFNYSIGSINLLNISGNLSMNLSINSSTGIINFTPTQNDIGEYAITINLTDSRGAVTQGSFNMSINNTNDAPVISSISFPNNINFDIPFYSISVISVDDEDLLLTNSTEKLFYSYNITPLIPDVFNMNNLTGAIILNTSIPGCNISYQVNFTVTDLSNASDSVVENFTINNRGDSPIIGGIYPYGNLSNNNSIILDWNSSLDSNSGGTTIVVADEGDSIIFNHSTTDGDDPILTYVWKINDINVTDSRLIDSSHTLNFTNGYFSSGDYQISIDINDSSYNYADWTWNLTVNNINREPILIHPLPNFTGLRSFSYIEINNYFTLPSVAEEDQRFYDADFDLNDNDLLDLNETSNLQYNYSNGCSDNVNVTVINDTLRLVGMQAGNCSMFFGAIDIYGAFVLSNEVYLNITAEYTQPEPQDNPTSGSSSSRAVPISLDNEDEPMPLQIIAPKSVVMYYNSTLIVPFELKNNWSTSLIGITISAETGEENVKYSLSHDYFASIPIGQSEFINMTIYNYREPGSYEIKVYANLVSPEFEDSAIILINSLEESYKGETLETKLAFARDLLDSSDDCKELYEILSQAEEALSVGNQEKAREYLDLSINGCRYMITNKDIIKNESAGKINLIIDHNFLRDLLKNKIVLIISGIIVFIIVIGLFLIRHVKIKKSKMYEGDIYPEIEGTKKQANNIEQKQENSFNDLEAFGEKPL